MRSPTEPTPGTDLAASRLAGMTEGARSANRPWVKKSRARWVG